MDINQINKEYEQYTKDYRFLQKEVRRFINFLKKNSTNIDIVEVKSRPNNDIKSIDSITENFSKHNKYKGYSSIFEIKDIAGIRIICHCEDDVKKITNLLLLELQKESYIIIDTEQKGEKNTGKSNPSYKATHIVIEKVISGNKLLCEIQIRTVMSDARAVQDRKYIYGSTTEGESVDLTNAVAQIMTGCEQLWTLVKNKRLNNDGIGNNLVSSDFNNLSIKKTLNIEKVYDSLLDSRFSLHEEKSSQGLKEQGIKTYMKIKSIILQQIPETDLKLLKHATQNSTIKTFGRPIGVSFTPKPDSNGIYEVVSIQETSREAGSYDYWTVNKKGAFYLKKSLFEDKRDPKKIFFNTRIVRITEVFMYLKNLYSIIGIGNETLFEVTIEHGGLLGRILGSSSPNRPLFGERKINIDNISTTIITNIKQINESIIEIVESYTKELFEQFDFFELDKKVLEDIVSNYISGRVV